MFAHGDRRAQRAADAVFDLGPDGFVVFDREGGLVYCKPAFQEMTGRIGDTLTAGATCCRPSTARPRC